MNLSPAFTTVVLFSVIHGTLGHLWKGHDWLDLPLFLLTALIGMMVGQGVGYLLDLDLLRMGQIYVLEGSVLAWLLMLGVAWLKG